MTKAKLPPLTWLSGLAHLGWPSLSKEDGDRIIKLVRPGTSQHDDCLREAALSVQWIRRKTASTRSPGERKDALNKAAQRIAAVIASIKKLPIAIQTQLQLDAFQHSLDRARALAEEIKVTSSGGKLVSRIDAAKKRAAADCAISLLRTWSGKPPTLSRTGPYFELAALLFELATGKIGDVERACKERLRAKTLSVRNSEMWEMLFELNGVPKVFEDSK